jgi:hypothetical protein
LNAFAISSHFGSQFMVWHIPSRAPCANEVCISIGFAAAQLVIDVGDFNGVPAAVEAFSQNERVVAAADTNEDFMLF